MSVGSAGTSARSPSTTATRAAISASTPPGRLDDVGEDRLLEQLGGPVGTAGRPLGPDQDAHPQVRDVAQDQVQQRLADEAGDAGEQDVLPRQTLRDRPLRHARDRAMCVPLAGEWGQRRLGPMLGRLAPRQAGQPVAQPVDDGPHPRRDPSARSRGAPSRSPCAARTCGRRGWPRRPAQQVAVGRRRRGRPGRSPTVRRSQRSSSTDQASTTGVTASGWPASVSRTRWVAVSSTTSHQAPVDDEVPPQRQRLRVEPRAGPPVPGDREGGVPLLAVGRAVPEVPDRRLPRGAGRRARTPRAAVAAAP